MTSAIMALILGDANLLIKCRQLDYLDNSVIYLDEAKYSLLNEKRFVWAV